jgi:uncharacterized protein (DUF2164 family)
VKEIDFTRGEKEQLAAALRNYLADELSVEIGQFDAEFLFDFVSQEFGHHFYNKGLADAQTVIAQKLDEVTEALDEIAI